MKVVRKHAGELKRKYYTVHSVSGGLEFKNGKPTGKLAVCVNVTQKIPEHSLRDDQTLPAEIDGFPVDVLEYTPRPFDLTQSDREQPFDPICGGIATTSDLNLGMEGTIGAIVFDSATRKKCAISNAHVWSGPGAFIGLTIYQPGDGSRPIGTLLRSDPNFDCSLCLLEEPFEAAATTAIVDQPYALAGVVPMADIVLNMPVEKSGVKTGVTRGFISHVDTQSFQVDVTTDDGTLFSDHGDSGSVIVDSDTKRAVALLWGGDNSFTRGYMMANVADTLKISVV